MSHQLQNINSALRRDPSGFLAQCDYDLQTRLEGAADSVIANLGHSPVVLLSGPSGSGKTTAARKLEEILNRRGIGCHAVSMDDYFLPIDLCVKEYTPEGDVDLESPGRLDMPLLDADFTKLARGQAIEIPKFNFTTQARNDETTYLRLKKDEIAIFEGIHALNDEIAGRHPETATIYLSARTNIMDGADLRFKATWMRIVRRAVRDYNFRGVDMATTLSTWYSVRRGEKRYISPFKEKANVMIDSSLPYEVSLLANYAQPLADALTQVNPMNERFAEYHDLVRGFDHFEPLNPQLLAKDSLLREFIGGGIY